MAIKPTELPTLTTQQQAEVRRLEKNIDKAILTRWDGKPVTLDARLFGNPPIRETLKRKFVAAGWVLVQAGGKVTMTPTGYLPPEEHKDEV
jgi:hypothetical protein